MQYDPTPGISASMTVGELVRMVDPHGLERPTYLAVETVGRDPDLDDQIMRGVRARRLPFVLTGVTGAAGWVAWRCAEAATPDTRSTVVVGTMAATTLALPVLRAAFRHRIPESWRRRWWLTGALAAGWVDWAVMHGPDSWAMTGALVVGGVALSARWWAEWEVPNPRGVDEPAPRPAIDMSRAAQIETAFSERAVGGRSAIAPGATRLTHRTELPHGFRWLVELDPEGSVGTTEFVGMAAPLARFFGVRPSHVLVERLEGDADREDRAWMTVVTRDALAGGVPYLGPRYDDGEIPIGQYADEGGEAIWRAKNNTGPLNGVVIGGKGSGKSVLLAALGMAYRASGEWFVVFGDGDSSGNSSPLLRKVADDFAKGDDVLEQLAALEAWYAVRGTMMGGFTDGPDGLPIPITDPARQEPVEKILPCLTYPGLVWIIDEFHRLVKQHGQPFVERFLAMVRIIRKYGGSVIVGTQAGLVDDFGDGTLRSLLLDNLVMLRSKNKSERSKVSDFGVSPSTLPMGGGYCFVDNGEGRAVMARIAYSADMGRWVQTLPQLELDRRSALAYARHRHPKAWDPLEHHRKVQDALAAVDIALETGAALPGEQAVTAKPDRSSQPTSVGGVPIPRAPGRASTEAPPGGAKVIPMHKPAKTGPTPVAPLSALGPVPANAARVLDALRSRAGTWRTSELAAHTGLTLSAVSKALGALDERGLVRRQHGLAEAV